MQQFDAEFPPSATAGHRKTLMKRMLCDNQMTGRTILTPGVAVCCFEMSIHLTRGQRLWQFSHIALAHGACEIGILGGATSSKKPDGIMRELGSEQGRPR